MRIISGKYRGKQFHLPGNFRARPTTDFAKTGLFNIISNSFNFEEIEVLDLFSGTGSIGFEFASRGAAYVEMVEKNYLHFNFIKNTIANLKVDNVKVFKTDAFIYIPRINKKFDIIFADPPYEMIGIEKIPGLVLKYNLLKDQGLFIIEHSKDHDFADYPGFYKLRKYGNVSFSFFTNLTDTSSPVPS